MQMSAPLLIFIPLLSYLTEDLNPNPLKQGKDKCRYIGNNSRPSNSTFSFPHFPIFIKYFFWWITVMPKSVHLWSAVQISDIPVPLVLQHCVSGGCYLMWDSTSLWFLQTRGETKNSEKTLWIYKHSIHTDVALWFLIAWGSKPWQYSTHEMWTR